MNSHNLARNANNCYGDGLVRAPLLRRARAPKHKRHYTAHAATTTLPQNSCTATARPTTDGTGQPTFHESRHTKAQRTRHTEAEADTEQKPSQPGTMPHDLYGDMHTAKRLTPTANMPTGSNPAMIPPFPPTYIHRWVRWVIDRRRPAGGQSQIYFLFSAPSNKYTSPPKSVFRKIFRFCRPARCETPKRLIL